MSERSSERRAELIAAALSDDLSPDERHELESMMRTDPSIAVEMEELGATVQVLGGIGAVAWLDDEPAPELRERVVSVGRATTGDGREVPNLEDSDLEVSDLEDSDLERRRRGRAQDRERRRWPRYVPAAAAGLVAGVAITAGAFLLGDRPPSGPPGTLGAVEGIELVGEPTGVEVDGSLIAHTWGTETVLEVDGLETGESYVLVLVSDSGDEYDSGTFLGSEVTIECRMNAAVMRHEVDRLEIRHENGAVVTAADLPDAVES